MFYFEYPKCTKLNVYNIYTSIEFNPFFYSYNEYTCTIDKNTYTIEYYIDRGETGNVWKGKLNKTIDVAIKFSPLSMRSHIKREIDGMTKFKSQSTEKYNVVELLDYYLQQSTIDTDRSTIAVYEYLDSGHILDFVESNMNSNTIGDSYSYSETVPVAVPIDAMQTTCVLLNDISKILAEISRLGMMHCDVKSENILISVSKEKNSNLQLNVKKNSDENLNTNINGNISFYLSDFGLMHPLDRVHYCGSPAYMSKPMLRFMFEPRNQEKVEKAAQAQHLADVYGLSVVGLIWYGSVCNDKNIVECECAQIIVDNMNEMKHKAQTQNGLANSEFYKLQNFREFLLDKAVTYEGRKSADDDNMSSEAQLMDLLNKYIIHNAPDVLSRDVWTEFQADLMKINACRRLF